MCGSCASVRQVGAQDLESQHGCVTMPVYELAEYIGCVVSVCVLFVLQRGPKRPNSQQAQPRAEAPASTQGKQKAQHAGATSQANCNTCCVLFVCLGFLYHAGVDISVPSNVLPCRAV
jgi:hypothetical protein